MNREFNNVASVGCIDGRCSDLYVHENHGSLLLGILSIAAFTLLKYPDVHFSSKPRAAIGNGQLVWIEISHGPLNNVAVGTIVYAQDEVDLSGCLYPLQQRAIALFEKQYTILLVLLGDCHGAELLRKSSENCRRLRGVRECQRDHSLCQTTNFIHNNESRIPVLMTVQHNLQRDWFA